MTLVAIIRGMRRFGLVALSLVLSGCLTVAQSAYEGSLDERSTRTGHWIQHNISRFGQ